MSQNQTDHHDLKTPPGLRAGVTEEMIDPLVRRFYDRIRADEMLGPVFDAAITNWEPHLLKMIDFWSSVSLLTDRYNGRPMPAHVQLLADGIDLREEHFAHWLVLFRQTTAEVCPPSAAEFFNACAANIARSLLMGMDMYRAQASGAMPAPKTV